MQGPPSFAVGELISSLALPPPGMEEQAGWGRAGREREGACLLALVSLRLADTMPLLSGKESGAITESAVQRRPSVLDGRKNFPPAHTGKALLSAIINSASLRMALLDTERRLHLLLLLWRPLCS